MADQEVTGCAGDLGDCVGLCMWVSCFVGEQKRDDLVKVAHLRDAEFKKSGLSGRSQQICLDKVVQGKRNLAMAEGV